MKTGSIIWMFIALMLTSVTVTAQGRRNQPCRAFGSGFGSGNCIYVLADLNEDQKTTIAHLVETHQEAMAGLREKQRATTDLSEKNAIRTEMLQAVQAHRNEVRSLLTEEQQKQYDMLYAQGGIPGRRFSAGRAAGRGPGGAGRYGFRGGW